MRCILIPPGTMILRATGKIHVMLVTRLNMPRIVSFRSCRPCSLRLRSLVLTPSRRQWIPHRMPPRIQHRVSHGHCRVRNPCLLCRFLEMRSKRLLTWPRAHRVLHCTAVILYCTAVQRRKVTIPPLPQVRFADLLFRHWHWRHHQIVYRPTHMLRNRRRANHRHRWQCLVLALKLTIRLPKKESHRALELESQIAGKMVLALLGSELSPG